MTTELLEAAKQMLQAVSGMHIEFVDREKRVDAAEDRLRRAVKEAETAKEADPP